MLSKKFSYIRTLGIALLAGGIIFLIYIVLFNNSILASIIGITTAIFTIVTGGITLFNMTMKQRYQDQLRQKAHASDRIQFDEHYEGNTPSYSITMLEESVDTPHYSVTAIEREQDTLPNSVTVLEGQVETLPNLVIAPEPKQDISPNLVIVQEEPVDTPPQLDTVPADKQDNRPKSDKVPTEEQGNRPKSDKELIEEQDTAPNLPIVQVEQQSTIPNAITYLEDQHALSDLSKTEKLTKKAEAARIRREKRFGRIHHKSS